jgi:hypothetical protein
MNFSPFLISYYTETKIGVLPNLNGFTCSYRTTLGLEMLKKFRAPTTELKIVRPD